MKKIFANGTDEKLFLEELGKRAGETNKKVTGHSKRSRFRELNSQHFRNILLIGIILCRKNGTVSDSFLRFENR